MIHSANRGNYDPVQLHYTDSKPEGILVFDNNLNFILGLKDLGEMDWESAMCLADSTGQRLPTKKEWLLVSKYRDQINHLLESVKESHINSNNYYWSSDKENVYNRLIWTYNSNCKIGVVLNGNANKFTVRTIKSQKTC